MESTNGTKEVEVDGEQAGRANKLARIFAALRDWARGESSNGLEADRKPGYYVMPGDWNSSVQRDNLTLEEVYEVLESFDEVYEPAMNGLAKVDPSKFQSAKAD